MTSARQFWTETIAKRLTTQLGTPISQNEIVTPPDKNLGDFAFGCFRLAKEQKKKPNEIANQIASGFDGSALEIASVSAAGPYVNFTLKTGEAVHRVICDIEQAKDSYGQNTSGQNQELLLEYATLNTHKEAHVGHVRVLSLGAALGHLLETNGWKVIRNSYLGDVGAHVAKCLWHLVKKNGFNPNQFGIQDADKLLHGIIKEQRTGRFLGETYAESTRAMENDPEAKQEVSLVLKNLEAHDPAWEKLWKETRRWSLDELSAIFEELGTQRIDKQYLESDVVDRGQAIVDELLKKGIAKISQGAVIVDLEDVGLGVFLIRKSDGSTLYATKDLALAEQKAKDFPNYARALFVVDNRQSFYFKQLFETLKRMGFSKRQEFVGFEFVTLKAGAMSSREGNVVTYESFRDAVLNYARNEIIKRHEKDGWSSGQVEEIAWKLAMGGIKFGMLKQDSDRIMTFDLEQALSFEGATGPYCQYAATRLGSILKKAQEKKIQIQSGDLSRDFDHSSEKQLALVLAEFPERVLQAAQELRPSIIAQWCLECAQRINDFYRDVPVLESETALLDSRLRMCQAARSVLSKGLDLLGIPVPEQM